MSLVRPARLADAEAIARIEVETWRTTYAGMLPDRVLLNMSERRQTVVLGELPAPPPGRRARRRRAPKGSDHRLRQLRRAARQRDRLRRRDLYALRHCPTRRARARGARCCWRCSRGSSRRATVRRWSGSCAPTRRAISTSGSAASRSCTGRSRSAASRSRRWPMAGAISRRCWAPCAQRRRARRTVSVREGAWRTAVRS